MEYGFYIWNEQKQFERKYCLNKSKHIHIQIHKQA